MSGVWSVAAFYAHQGNYAKALEMMGRARQGVVYIERDDCVPCRLGGLTSDESKEIHAEDAARLRKEEPDARTEEEKADQAPVDVRQEIQRRFQEVTEAFQSVVRDAFAASLVKDVGNPHANCCSECQRLSQAFMDRRCSGRTSRMLRDLLLIIMRDLSTGNAIGKRYVVVAPTIALASNLRSQLHALVNRFGLPMADMSIRLEFKTVWEYAKNESTGYLPEFLFVDHSCWSEGERRRGDSKYHRGLDRIAELPQWRP